MKKVKVVSVVLVCLMSLVFVSCEDSVTGAGGGTGGGGQEAALNGTWVYAGGWEDPHSWIFDNGNFEYYFHGDPRARGTFTISGNNLLISPTHFHGGQGWGVWTGGRVFDVPLGFRWYSRIELRSAVTNYLRSAGVPDGGISEAMEGIEISFSPIIVPFTLVGSILTLTFPDGWVAQYIRS